MHFLETAANWAWETSLAASILIVPALVAALLLRNPRLAPFRHMLGLLIVARLLLPFSIPSPFSIFNIVQPESIWNAASQRRFHFQRPEPAQAQPAPQSIEVSPTPLPQFASTPRPFPIVPSLWTLGVLAIVARVAFQHLKIRRCIRASNQITSGPVVDALNAALELSGCSRHVNIYSVPNLSTPALFGLFRPSILVPTDLAQSNDLTRLRLVFLHEIAHLKRLDVLTNWTMIVAQTLHWFNPLVWLAMRRLRADQELLCDADVMRILQPHEHRAYGETLLALASPRNYTLSTVIPVSSSFKQLKERIGMIKQYKPAARVAIIVIPALAAFIAMMTFTAAVNQPNVQAAAADAQRARDEQIMKKRAMEMDRLTEATDEQRQRQMEIINQMDEFRKRFGIIGDPPNGAAIAAAEAEKVRTLATEVTRLDLKIAESEERLRAVEKAEGKFVGDLVKDEALRKLADELDGVHRRRAVQLLDFTEDHPKVKEAEIESKQIQLQMDRRVGDILGAMRMTLDLDKATKARYQKEKEVAALHCLEIEEQTRAFFTLKQRLQTVTKRYETLAERLEDARINGRLNAE